MRCIALDDEPVALALLCSYIKRTAGLELVAGHSDPLAALERLREGGWDLLILDLHMPGLHGFDLLKRLAFQPLAIVTTAHGQHAVQSYDLEVADYLLKPFGYDRFTLAIERARLRRSLRETDSVTVRTGTGRTRVPIRDIAYIEAFDDYVKVHRPQQRPLVALGTMKGFEASLPPDWFVRIHRSYIVGWPHVVAVKDRKVHLLDQELPIGDTYWQMIKLRMDRDVGR